MAKLLRDQGFEILHQNLRTPFGEVDVVAVKADCLFIIEVKTRRGLRDRIIAKRPEVGQFISYSQQRRLRRAARWLWGQYRRKYGAFRGQLLIVTDCEIRWVNLSLLYDSA